MNSIPSAQDNPNGLHQRYIVSKANGKAVDPNAIYFVLRLDSGGGDQMHINACRHAALQYAEYVMLGNSPHLAQLGWELHRLVDGLDVKDET
jgi:hypothetical protein